MPKNNSTALEKTFNDLLKKENDFFNFAGESLIDGLWCWNSVHPESGYINGKFAQLLGYSPHPNTSVQIDFLSLVHTEDLEGVQSAFQGLLSNSPNNPLNIDVRLGHTDGHYIWLNLRGNLVADESEAGQGLIGTAQCIDRYMESERQLHINKDYYENVIKGANIGIWEGNLLTGEVICNERWADMFGYTLAELEPLTYTTFLNLVHPEDIGKIDVSLENHLKESGIYELEFRLLHKMGHWVWVLSRGEVTKYGTDGLPEIVSGIHYDISNRKVNEILLEKYKDLFERSSEVAKIGYWELDDQENTVFWSKVNKQIHGVSEDYTPTVEAGLDFYLEGENRERMKKVICESLEKPMEFDEQLQIKTQKGKLKWVRLIGASEYQGNKSLRLYGLIQDIDEIKKVQLQIKFREEQFRQTFNHSAMGMALINIENKLLKANKSLCHILGYTEEELQKIDLAEMAHPEDLKVNRKYIEELFQGKHKYIKLDHRFIHKDGSVIWANISMSAIHNDQGQVIHYVSQVQDITERKHNELLLAHNAEVMQRINDAVSIGIWELDLGTNTVYWSPTIKKMVEVPEDYKPTLDEVYPFFQEGEHREALIDALGRAVDKGEGFDLELKVVTTTQRIFWSRTIGIPEMVDGVCTRLYGFFQDIDEKTRATKDLAVKEEEMRQTFEHAAIGMIVVDLNGKLRKANPKICEILGYGEKEILEKTVFDFVHPEDVDSAKVEFEGAIAVQGGFKTEKRCRHKDGSYIWIYEAVASVKNDKGELMHFVAQIQDISDKKQMTENLTEHNNRLTNFAHIVSHNLRSHTSNISMLLDLAVQDDPKVLENEYYRNVKVVSDNMNETIRQLSEIVEINSQVSSTLTSQNLLKRVHKAMKTVDPVVRKNKATILAEVDANINVLAVHAYLESIILNLITNAIKYRSPERLPELKITSGTKGEYAFLSFEDNGLGIDLDRHGSKLFGMYKTFHSHPEARGIGLFISKNQIEAMGGKIEVESELNKGTKFTAYFRIAL
ncbi:PAS domain-containing protein [Arenibacter algicola]|uniref:histidine kinase n=1 Tax=Arenibacter algicola TaxID=616991 RepID=A0A221UWA9_9FLAO|nr:PAS domain-containing protein [Arenibacter algicola]ASO05530.1 putative diguanylate cyclase YegE [Arenibacter algicola]